MSANRLIAPFVMFIRQMSIKCTSKTVQQKNTMDSRIGIHRVYAKLQRPSLFPGSVNLLHKMLCGSYQLFVDTFQNIVRRIVYQHVGIELMILQHVAEHVA